MTEEYVGGICSTKTPFANVYLTCKFTKKKTKKGQLCAISPDQIHKKYVGQLS